MKILLLLSFLLFGCSQAVLEKSRRISSADEIKIEKHERCPASANLMTDGCVSLSAKIKMVQGRSLLNKFEFPLIKLETPFFAPVPYTVEMKSEVHCEYSDDIDKNGKIFKIKNPISSTYLKCTPKDQARKFEFRYLLPTFETFPVSHAEWMDGFFPNVVSNTELKLAQILEKWNKAKRQLGNRFTVEDGITYRGRELLLKYSNSTQYQSLIPKKFKFQYEKEIAAGDILVIKNIEGNMKHPRFGEISPLGYATEHYEEEGSAGRRYLINKKIKPFEFFCIYKDQIIDFRTRNSYQFSEPGLIKCAINTKRKHLFEFRNTKGEVQFEESYLNLSRAIEKIPNQIANSEVRIENKIILMNTKNVNNFKKWLGTSVDEKHSKMVYELKLDDIFPATQQIGELTFERKGLQVCGTLSRGETGFSVVSLNRAQVKYGESIFSKSINSDEVFMTQIPFESTDGDSLDQCFPISARMFLAKSYLNAVLFYEP